VTEQAIEVDLGGVLGSWETTAPRDPELPSSFAMRQEWLQDLGGLGSEEAVMTYWILCRADWPRAQTSWFEGLSKRRTGHGMSPARARRAIDRLVASGVAVELSGGRVALDPRVVCEALADAF